MAIVLGLIGAAVLAISYVKFDEVPTIAGWGLLVGFAIIGGSLTLSTGGSSGDCYIDWDGRSNPEVCD